MVEIFKSPVNIARGAKISETIVSDPIAIEANSSAKVTLDFTQTYSSAPIVMYAVQCNDSLFSLTHNIVSIDASSVVICIENQAMVARNVTIMCDVRARK